MEKIKKLRKLFIREKVDGYIIPKNDEFFGEYTPGHNDRLNYISKFSGSYGFALILKNKNYLFVDGRYTLQAYNQSRKFFSIITFPKKMPCDVLRNKKLSIGFDPKLFTKTTLSTFFGKNCLLKPLKNNLVDKIWKRNIKAAKGNFYLLPNHSISETYESKINKIILNLKKRGADFQFISGSENNAWLFNIRGHDAEFTPIPYSHSLIDKNKNVKFFCDLSKVSPSLKKKLNKIKFVSIDFLSKILSGINRKKFIIDKNTCSSYFDNIISESNELIDFFDPIYDLKAIKSKKEIENIKKAHIYDGAALTKFLFWLKKNFNKKKITEISASKKLYDFRKINKKFKFLSFPTISGSGPNGAIIHYKPDEKTNRKLKKGDIYLVDSGGQYEFGTTDVTRTVSLDNYNNRIKDIFTRVLKGHIAVADFQLKKKTSGSQIDVSARKYLRQIGLDYMHGTGHGVGYFLNVHEGPHAISKNNKIKFQKGMIVSNEPGYYEKNNFGIRIENLIYVKKIKQKKVFENLTMVPIDKELINKKLLNSKERKWLNNYHKKVFDNIKGFMLKNEIKDLKKACSII